MSEITKLPQTPLSALAERLAAAQAEIEAAIERSGLKRDPYGHVVAALGSALAVFSEHVRTIEAAVERTRLPSPILSHDGERKLIDRQAERIIPAVQGELMRWRSWYSRQFAFGFFIAGTLAMMAGMGLGYFAGWRAADGHLLLEACKSGDVHADKSGRRYCVTSLWLDPEAAKP